MITFICAILALVAGYFIYGAIVEKIFGIEPDRETPAIKNPDGVDFVPLDWIRSFLIQLLNIAGTGPIFGAIAGALWGPVAFLWIVFGCIFGGAVHDFLAGMLSVRNNGKTVGDIVGVYLGTGAQQIMRVFSLILLILVGVVFISSPAGILTAMTGVPLNVWIAVAIVYYLIATVVPVDKIIGKLYPIFGASLLLMCVGIGGGLILGVAPHAMPELSFENLHPRNVSIFPFLFISIACGAISGFHATQAPMIARCLKNESQGRRVFYGAMIAEGVIALIWAAAAMTFFGGTVGLSQAGAAPVVVNTISQSMLGPVGGILAVLGVVICPITSGDTAFRGARLIVADALKLDQQSSKNRFIIAIPMFVVAIILCNVDFNIIWRYFSWSNQTLATIVLWTSAVYLATKGKFHWIATLPATFMTSVVTTYIIMAPEGLKLPETVGIPCGIIMAIASFSYFMFKISKKSGDNTVTSND